MRDAENAAALRELKQMTAELDVGIDLDKSWHLVNIQILTAVWKRIKVLEAGFNQLADQKLATVPVPARYHRASTEADLHNTKADPGDRGFTVDDQRWWVYEGWKRV